MITLNTISTYNSQPLRPAFASREGSQLNNRTIGLSSKYTLIDPKQQEKTIFTVLGTSFVKALGINPNAKNIDTDNDVVRSIDTARYWVV